MRVRVHPHRGRYLRGLADCVSVTPDPGSGVEYHKGVLLSNAHFRVHRSGFERMQREGKRNVHAWGVGDLEYSFYTHGWHPQDVIDNGWVPVRYDFTRGVFTLLHESGSIDITPGRWGGRFKEALCLGRNFYVREQ